MSTAVRVYLWLIVHDACLCRVGLRRVCDRLERRLLSPEGIQHFGRQPRSKTKGWYVT